MPRKQINYDNSLQGLDDFQLIQEMKKNNINFSLPVSTRSKYLKQIATPTALSVLNQSRDFTDKSPEENNVSFQFNDEFKKRASFQEKRIQELELKLAQINDNITIFNVFGQFAGSLTVITSTFYNTF